MRRTIVQVCAAFAAIMAGVVGVRAVCVLLMGGRDGIYGLIAGWCVCVIVSSLAALGRRA